MSEDDEKSDLDKTSVVASDTLKIRLNEAVNAPPALVLLMGPAHLIGKQWPITKEETIIGRVHEVQICVEDRSLSKKHARLVLEGQKVFIEDMGSTNGTAIGALVLTANSRIELENNTQVKLGNVIFKYLEQGNLETVAVKGTYDRTQLDPLTGIYNKGALIAAGQEVFKRAKLTEIPVSVIAFDLDNFKKVNDTYGHQAGDYVLKELSQVIQKKLIRQGDYFARFGGEEFCLILTGSNLQKSVEVAERIRSTIEKHDFVFAGNKLAITISVGVATLESTMNAWEDLYEKADQASYIAKKGGKNRVSII